MMEKSKQPAAYNRIKAFLTRDMVQSHIYQPLMLKELLQNKGTADVETIARAILDHDPTQVEYYSRIVKNMVGKVLTKSRGITTRNGDTYRIEGVNKLTRSQLSELVGICDEKIAAYLAKRGQEVWSHRRRGHRPVSGSIRYEVLARAAFRCELCGIAANEKALDVDHIHPKSLGGKDGLENYQALCYSCNSAKRNTDSRDFRGLKELYALRDPDCLFCRAQTSEESRITENDRLAYAMIDAFPVTALHTLIIPRRHVPDYFGLTQPDINSIHRLVTNRRSALVKHDSSIDGFNIGVNCGESAGQTVFHCHIHLIPRRKGDVSQPKGGVRHLMPGKGIY